MKNWWHLIGVVFLLTCNEESVTSLVEVNEPYLVVLGIAQDAGYPQADCKKKCCEPVWTGKQEPQMVSCLGVVDPQSDELWLLDATPDFKTQLHLLQQLEDQASTTLSGVLLTHAHIGHYTGLMQLGREAMGARSIPVYAMPRMTSFLKTNGPWSQLVNLKNIELHPLKADSTIQLNQRITIQPLVVPHRDEFSETVGFKITGARKSALFIPDIDKWEKWDQDIRQLIPGIDYAFLDGTFFQNGELPGRDMSEIPHPFVEESMQLFDSLPGKDKSKIHFIHFNHTNPLLQPNSPAQWEVKKAGFNIAQPLATFTL